MRKYILGIVILVVIVVFVVNIANKNISRMESGEEMTPETSSEVLEDLADLSAEELSNLEEQVEDLEEDVMEESLEQETGDIKVQFLGEQLAGSTTPLYNFNMTDYQTALDAGYDIILYWYAQWCPTCRRELKNGAIPGFDQANQDNVVGFRVHYDDKFTTSDDLAITKQFQVAYRHVKVLINNGDESDFEKTPAVTWSPDEYVQNINELALK